MTNKIYFLCLSSVRKSELAEYLHQAIQDRWATELDLPVVVAAPVQQQQQPPAAAPAQHNAAPVAVFVHQQLAPAAPAAPAGQPRGQGRQAATEVQAVAAPQIDQANQQQAVPDALQEVRAEVARLSAMIQSHLEPQNLQELLFDAQRWHLMAVSATQNFLITQIEAILTFTVFLMIGVLYRIFS